MSRPAIALEQIVAQSDTGEPSRAFELPSGRQVRVGADAHHETIEVSAPDGQVMVTIQLTEAGPAIFVEGATLQLKASDTLSLQARRVEITAHEAAVLKSNGQMSVQSQDELEIDSQGEVRVTGEMIHLN